MGMTPALLLISSTNFANAPLSKPTLAVSPHTQPLHHAILVLPRAIAASDDSVHPALDFAHWPHTLLSWQIGRRHKIHVDRQPDNRSTRRRSQEPSLPDILLHLHPMNRNK